MGKRRDSRRIHPDIAVPVTKDLTLLQNLVSEFSLTFTVAPAEKTADFPCSAGRTNRTSALCRRLITSRTTRS